MTTAERLNQYYDFDEAVTVAIEETANRQNGKTFAELAEEHGLADGPQSIKPFEESRRLLEYIALVPEGDYDETKSRILFAPMGIPVDQNMAMRAMRLFDAHPDEQLMVVGSPAAIGNNANLLRMADLPAVWSGNLGIVTEPTLYHLYKQKVSIVDTLGYSYGADAAVAAAAEADDFGIEVSRGVWAEPAAITARGLLRLGKDFMATGGQLQHYVDAANSKPLHEARVAADTGFARWLGGLVGRASNLAIAHALSQDGFLDRAKVAYDKQPGLQSAIAWGTASELTDSATMQCIVEGLEARYDANRTLGMSLRGMHHAGGDDIDLHAAIMLQGLRGRNEITD